MALAARAVLLCLGLLFASLYPMQPVVAAETTQECSDLLGQPRALSLLELLEDPRISGLYFEGGNSLEVLADLLLERQHPYGYFLSVWKKYQDALRAEETELARSLKVSVDAAAIQLMPSLVPAKLRLAVASVIFPVDGRVRGLRIHGDAVDTFRAEGGVEFMRALRMDTFHVDGGADEVTLVQGFLSELSGLTDLEVLYLDGVRFDNVAELNELGRLTQLRKFGLRLIEPILGAFEVTVLFQSISRMTQLETLRLNAMDTWIDFETIASLRNLTELDFSEVDLSANQLFALSRLPKLKKLKLRDSRITELTGSMLSTQGKFSTLTHLGLARSEVSLDALLALAGAQTLTHMDLSDLSSKVSWAKVWKKLSAAPQLRQLNLLGSASVDDLKGLEEVKSLTHLLAGSQLRDLPLTPGEQKQVQSLTDQLPLIREFRVYGDEVSTYREFGHYRAMFSAQWAVAGLPDRSTLWIGEVSAKYPTSGQAEPVRGHTHGPAALVYPGHTHR